MFQQLVNREIIYWSFILCFT